MSFEIRYTSKYTGQETVHKYSGSEAGARGWAETLAQDHGCRAEATHVADGPYDYSGDRTHVVTEGHARRE